MATFLSKYSDLMIRNPKGRTIVFKGGVYDTDDAEEIKVIKSSTLFNSFITESAGKVEVDKGSKRRVKDAGGK